MALTVKEVSDLSGISVRTLHFYDEIGLLKPSFYGDNGYRFYEEPQLLTLQQILFFRELGFQLTDIQRVMTCGAFEQLEALQVHRRQLKQKVERLQTLMGTIDKTIAHLKGEATMAAHEMYEGFDPVQQAKWEQDLRDRYGEGVNSRIEESKRRVAEMSKAEMAQIQADLKARDEAMKALLTAGASPDSPETQALARKHFDWLNHFYTPDKEMFIGLGQLYCDHPDFRKRYDALHPGMAEYWAQAMRVFAERELG